ncbi:nitronate monooxygenase [Mycobacterium tuberculosis]
MLVAQGTEAGGHGHGPRSTLTPSTRNRRPGHRAGTDIPVIAAGGIAHGRGLAAALGAAGYWSVRRFYATVEALSTPQARDPLLAATGDDMCRTTIYDQLRRYRPQGHTMSVLSNASPTNSRTPNSTILHREEAMARYWRAVAARDYSIANVTAGQARAWSMPMPAADVITGMAQQAARTLTAMRAVNKGTEARHRLRPRPS